MEQVQYIKDHLALESIPEDIKKSLVKVLITLFRVRKINDFPTISLNSLNAYQELVNQNSEVLSGLQIYQIFKAIGLGFPSLSVEEADEIYQYLSSHVVKRENSLEDFIKRELKVETKQLYEINENVSDMFQRISLHLAISNCMQLENFSFQQKISSEKMTEIIASYCTSIGCESSSNIEFEWVQASRAGKQVFLVTFSTTGNNGVLITVKQ